MNTAQEEAEKFYYKHGVIRSKLPSDAYIRNYDLIFRKTLGQTTDVNSDEEFNKENKRCQQ